MAKYPSAEDREKNLYKNSKNFVLSSFSSEEKGNPSDSPDGEIKKFKLSELVPGNPEKHGKFVYDLPDAANFDVSKIKRAKQGVIEIMRDALNKAKAQAAEIRKGSLRNSKIQTRALGNNTR